MEHFELENKRYQVQVCYQLKVAGKPYDTIAIHSNVGTGTPVIVGTREEVKLGLANLCRDADPYGHVTEYKHKFKFEQSDMNRLHICCANDECQFRVHMSCGRDKKKWTVLKFIYFTRQHWRVSHRVMNVNRVLRLRQHTSVGWLPEVIEPRVIADALDSMSRWLGHGVEDYTRAI